ncbi:uncharacterized protein METZ01_LOCUS10988, partial [marine metagenome]
VVTDFRSLIHSNIFAINLSDVGGGSMSVQPARTITLVVIGFAILASTAPVALVAQAENRSQWVLLRTPEGHPDIQGNWTNATITPVQRSNGVGPVLTPEQVAAIEGGRQEFLEEGYADSDPDREAPPAGGVFSGNLLFDAASGGTGGYNQFWVDAGDRVAIFNGEHRSSLVTSPEDGRIPALTPAAQRRIGDTFVRNRQFGEFDNPENRPLPERCLMSFGSNGGPPMLPNYFYNNNYTIVQTSSHIMIMTEMVHDVRIIPLSQTRQVLPEHIRPWMGNSWGRWEGDTLVVETTNLPIEQVTAYSWLVPTGSENFKVIERFTRAGEFTLNYEFTVIDPDSYESEWGGEVPFRRLDGLVYEYACHEGNYSLENVLRGARAEEREAERIRN